MSFNEQESPDRSHDEDYPPVWVGMTWGVVSVLAGCALMAALWSFNVQEIGWDFLNSGPELATCSNYLGSFGLYVAGILYWFFGGMAWGLACMLMWWGAYRLAHRGEFENAVNYGGWGMIVGACILMAASHLPTDAWVAAHQLKSAGGLVGYLLASEFLEPLLGASFLIILAGVGYIVAMIYAAGLKWKPFIYASFREWKAWRAHRRERKLQGQTKRLAERNARVHESMAGATLTAPRSRVAHDSASKGSDVVRERRASSAEPASTGASSRSSRSLSHSGVSSSSAGLPRTGDDLEGLYSEVEAVKAAEKKAATRPSAGARPAAQTSAGSSMQAELGIKHEQKVTVVETPEIKPASKIQPFAGQGTPPTEEFKNYRLPGFDLLQYNATPTDVSDAEVEEMKEIQLKIKECLDEFKISVALGPITRGPAITRYEFFPARGVRVSVFEQYAGNIALATKARSLTVVAPIPGKDTIGIEIENRKKTPVFLRELLQDPQFCSPSKKIPVALGKNVYGSTVIGDLAKMPHLLVAGATGSGKSVCVNCIISSMILKFRPDELRMILVDPKMVEMMPYAKLPHLIVPVVTDPKKVANALRWCVNEMEHRYHCFSKVGVRNFEAFNTRTPDVPPTDEEPEYEAEPDMDKINSIADELENPGAWPADDSQDELDFNEEVIPERFPYIVVIIDELADLMMTVRADIETNIARITQKARAAGIHLIVATQSPRREILTGTIKANIPTRISCKVASGIDSRVILDQQGAEKLLGQGDLLYLPPGSSQLERAQGAFISDAEVEALVKHCASQAKQHFHEDVQRTIEEGPSSIENSPLDDPEEECYAKCLEVAVSEGEVSTSLLQRRLRIGYGKAARMIDMMEKRGVIGPSNGTNRPRKLLD